jgi:preprotein translocase SecE subunit
VANEEKKPKRKLVKSETVREKAEKQEASNVKPRRLHKTRRGITAPFRGIAWIFRKLNRIKPFRIIGYILVPPYFRNSWRELKQVTWPGFKLSRQLTTAVVLFAVIFGALIAVVDFGLDKLFKEVLLK